MAQRGGEHRGPEKGHAYGVASVTNALQGLDFPCSKQEIINKYGDKQIYWTKEHPEKLRDVLQQVPEQQFQSMADVTHAIGSARTGVR